MRKAVAAIVLRAKITMKNRYRVKLHQEVLVIQVAIDSVESVEYSLNKKK